MKTFEDILNNYKRDSDIFDTNIYSDQEILELMNKAVEKELNEIWEAFDKEGMRGSQNYILGRINKLKEENP